MAVKCDVLCHAQLSACIKEEREWGKETTEAQFAGMPDFEAPTDGQDTTGLGHPDFLFAIRFADESWHLAKIEPRVKYRHLKTITHLVFVQDGVEHKMQYPTAGTYGKDVMVVFEKGELPWHMQPYVPPF